MELSIKLKTNRISFLAFLRVIKAYTGKLNGVPVLLKSKKLHRKNYLKTSVKSLNIPYKYPSISLILVKSQAKISSSIPVFCNIFYSLTFSKQIFQGKSFRSCLDQIIFHTLGSSAATEAYSGKQLFQNSKKYTCQGQHFTLGFNRTMVRSNNMCMSFRFLC